MLWFMSVDRATDQKNSVNIYFKIETLNSLTVFWIYIYDNKGNRQESPTIKNPLQNWEYWC